MNNNLATVFPTTEANWHNENVRTEGLLIRDYFAAKAMAGILSGVLADGTFFDPKEAISVAVASYSMADAMLEARNK